MKPVWFQNVVECMKAMEVVLDESCSDLDYTAVKICIGRGQDESGTVKILKIGTPEIITIIVLHLEQLDFTVQYCVQKMQTK